MPPEAVFLAARFRWSIVVGATMAAAAIAGTAGALWLRRPAIDCYGAWEQVAQGVQARACVRRPRVGDGDHRPFVEVQARAPGRPAWFVEHDEGARVERVGDLVIVQRTAGWESDQEFVAYRLIDGEQLWRVGVPWIPAHLEGSGHCDMQRDDPPPQLLGGFEDVILLAGADERERSIIALDPANGARRWRVALDGQGPTGAVSIHGGELLVPGVASGLLHHIDADGTVTSSRRPSRSAASCLERAEHGHPLDPELASWLQADEARVDCFATGPRTLAIATSPSWMRVVLLAPDGAVRWKEERRGVTPVLPFDSRCRDLPMGARSYRTAAWLERPDGAEAAWDLVLFDTRRRSELRFGMPGLDPGRIEIVPWIGGTHIEGRVDDAAYVSFVVLPGTPRIVVDAYYPPVTLVPRSPQADALLEQTRHILRR